MFGKLFKSKKTPEQKLQEIADSIKNKTKKNSLKITVSDEKPSLFDSKFGGNPYWPENLEYPVDAEGKPMQLLVQINFSQSPQPVENFPESGILQFFIPQDKNDYGLNLSNPVSSDFFKVIYHSEINTDAKEETARKYFDFDSRDEYSTPVQAETKIILQPEESWIQISDISFQKFFTEALKEVLNITSEEDYQEFFDSKDFDKTKPHSREFFKLMQNTTSRTGGYPSFCQEDPRYTPALSPETYDTLLLQIDSRSTRNKVNFGDDGLCQIMINAQSLQTREFSSVLYNWDCY